MQVTKEMLLAVEKHPLSTYNYKTQKASAKRRGKEFLLTYEQWIDIWLKSGKELQRGIANDQYCMGRHNDNGPYSVDNVSIITGFENRSEGKTGYVWSKESKEQVSKSMQGKQNALKHKLTTNIIQRYKI